MTPIYYENIDFIVSPDFQAMVEELVQKIWGHAKKIGISQKNYKKEEERKILQNSRV